MVFSTAIIVVLALNFLLNTICRGGSYELVWSLLESLQVIQLIKLFNVRTPGNVGAFSAEFEWIARGQLVPRFIQNLFETPEQDAFSLNFQNAGFTTSLFQLNSQDFIFNFSLQVIMIVVLLILGIAAMKFTSLVKHRD